MVNGFVWRTARGDGKWTRLQHATHRVQEGRLVVDENYDTRVPKLRCRLRCCGQVMLRPTWYRTVTAHARKNGIHLLASVSFGTCKHEEATDYDSSIAPRFLNCSDSEVTSFHGHNHGVTSAFPGT